MPVTGAMKALCDTLHAPPMFITTVLKVPVNELVEQYTSNTIYK
jgi:hypothetical protein